MILWTEGEISGLINTDKSIFPNTAPQLTTPRRRRLTHTYPETRDGLSVPCILWTEGDISSPINTDKSTVPNAAPHLTPPIR